MGDEWDPHRTAASRSSRESGGARRLLGFRCGRVGVGKSWPGVEGDEETK